MQPLKKKKKKVNVMYTPKFSLSFTLLFSFLFIILQSLADISTMLIYARHSTTYTYTFFSYATCEWPEIFIQNKVLFCSVLFGNVTDLIHLNETSDDYHHSSLAHGFNLSSIIILQIFKALEVVVNS